jgi:hypothetical protein
MKCKICQNQGATWIRSLDKQEGSLVITQINSILHGKQPNLVLELDISLESRSKYKPAFLAVDILDAAGTASCRHFLSLRAF